MNEFERFLGKAKDTFEFALSKTEEVIDKGKAKFSVKQAEYEIKKLYEKIGKKVYEELKDGTSVSEEITGLVSEINVLKEKISKIESENL